MSDLRGVRLKLARAREHRKAVDLAVGDLRQTQPYAVLPEIDPNTGEQVWRVAGDPKPVPERIPVLAGDCLYNFRSALDHVAWQLVDIAGTRKPANRTMFPLFHDPVQFVKNRLWRMDGMSHEAIAAIIRCSRAMDSIPIGTTCSAPLRP